LERQLASAKTRCGDFEDTVLQLERDKGTHDRQLETVRLQLESESAKRTKLERVASSQKSELTQLKDRVVKLDRELNKALTELKNREWEVKQLESKQDKTIVEHVHVLEEAKRVTDRQLADAQLELQKNATYIRSLEKAKARLTSEAEDFARETERERLELRSKEKSAKSSEGAASRALADVQNERRAREAAELQARRLQQQLKDAQTQITDLSQEASAAVRSKNNLEMELARLADETDAPNSLAKMQRQYQSKIAQLESQLSDARSSGETASKIKEEVDRRHADLRRLIMSGETTDGGFRSRLLRELQLADDRLQKEMSTRLRRSGKPGSDIQTMANISPSNRSPDSPRSQRPQESSGGPRNLDRQISSLKAQVQVLELQMAASDRVRRHLEASIRDITADLENSDGSKQFLQQYRARLSKENARLAELLRDEAQARQAAEAAQMEGVQAMWSKFQRTMVEERESYSRLEESRKALASTISGSPYVLLLIV
jgi:myosin heavy chain 9/10/11/14